MNARRASSERGAPGRRTRILLLSVLFALFPLLAVVGPRRPAARLAAPIGEPEPPAPRRPRLLEVDRPARSAAPTAARPVEAAAVGASAPLPSGAPGAEPVERARLAITVHEGGRPAPGSSVEITRAGPRAGPEESPALARATDARGTLELDLPPGAVRVVAWRADTAALPVFAQLRAGLREEVVLALAPSWAVGGRVVDATSGRPIADATVAVWTFAESDVVRTAADGTFLHPRFPRAAPAQQVAVHAPGYGRAVRYLRLEEDGSWKLSAATAEETSQRGAGTPWLELALVPARAIRGRVLDADGEPLAGARVAAEGFFHVMPSVASRDEAEVPCDATGRFELTGLRSDIGHALVVEAPGHARRSLELPADAPLDLDLGDVALALEAALAGAVVDVDGRPLADVLVRLELVAPEAPLATSALDVAYRLESRTRTARTSPEGAFLFEGLEARPVRVTLETDGESRALGELLPLPDGTFPAPCLVFEPSWRVPAPSSAR